MNRKKLNWWVYEMRVTLVPQMTRPEEYATITTIIVTKTVTALDDRMAGLLACKAAEQDHPFYQALMYEQLKVRAI